SRNVVALIRAAAERADVGEERVEHFRRRLAEVGADAGDEPLVTEFLALLVHRLANAVTERHQQISRLEADRFLIVRGVLEQAEDNAAGFETTDAGRGDDHW